MLSLEHSLFPSEALPRINTFIPADDIHLTAMVDEGKTISEVGWTWQRELPPASTVEKDTKPSTREIDPNVEEVSQITLLILIIDKERRRRRRRRKGFFFGEKKRASSSLDFVLVTKYVKL